MAPESLDTLRATVRQGPPYEDAFLAQLRDDHRAGAQTLYRQCLRRIEQSEREKARIESMLAFERQAAAQGFCQVAGVDEAGRGPLAGPIVAAAVVLAKPVVGVDDSKKLTEQQRDALFEQLHQDGHVIGVKIIPPANIDVHGIQSANYAAMLGAAQAITPEPDYLLVDGFAIRGCPIPQIKIVKGDRRSMSIAAASIIAKVTRDRLMYELDQEYPEYGFAKNKGYGTADHLQAIEQFGPCPAHRRSFAPLSRMLESGFLFEEERT